MRLHVDNQRWDEAAAIAKDAAPYFHPRLSSVQMDADVKVERKVAREPLSEEELAKRFNVELPRERLQ
jgi:hypothetical protein